MKKIAFLSCGMLRSFEYCISSWDIFDSCDIFVYTWDKTTRPFTSDLCLPNIESLETAKKNKQITNYEVLCHKDELTPQKKNPYLWKYAATHLSWDYDYVFISRPDILLQKTNTIIYPKKGEISVLYHNDKTEQVQDLAMFMRRDDYVKFSQCYDFLKQFPDDIHTYLYLFIKNNFKFNQSLGSFIRTSLNRPDIVSNSFINSTLFDYNFQQEAMRWETAIKIENAISSSYKRIAILVVSNKINTLNDRENIAKKYNIFLPFFFESATEEMARDKCNKYEEVTGLNFDEIIVEYV